VLTAFKMPRALYVKQIEGKPGKVYYPIELKEIPRPKPGPNEVLVRLSAAALNHRDLFIRRHLYPAISFTAPLLADGYGTVVEVGSDVTSDQAGLLNRGVVLTPMRLWESDPVGPENGRGAPIIGSCALDDAGTAQDYVVVGADEVVPAPPHLTPTEAAALPLVGLTGWRALISKSNAAEPGRNILVTGIGGGVALQVLQFAAAIGCNVYVTSGDSAKIDRAVDLGARGGVSYKDADWDKQLRSMLPKDRPFLDAVIDGAGGDVVAKTVKLLKHGGVIVQYGMTVAPKMDWLMQANLANIELRGSTMGSKREFRDMVDFVTEKQIRPVVSKVVKGLDNLEAINGLFDDMDHGRQFGKLVIEIEPSETTPPKL
jgi:NADPH:quinone reductase-like Zn-dependent oxidoreductase